MGQVIQPIGIDPRRNILRPGPSTLPLNETAPKCVKKPYIQLPVSGNAVLPQV